MTLHESVDELDHEELLVTWESGSLLESTLELADGARAASRGNASGADEVLDADAERLCHLGQDV